MDEIFSNFHRKVEFEKKIQQNIEDLKNSSRVVAVKEVDTRLKELASTVRNKKETAKNRELAAEKFNSLSLEYQSLIIEMDAFLKEERKKATLTLVETVENLIVEIRQEISLIGKEQGFDLVLEQSGKTSSQIPAIIYLRDKTDITAEIIARLNAKDEEGNGE